jgi:hypothetical protein
VTGHDPAPSTPISPKPSITESTPDSRPARSSRRSTNTSIRSGNPYPPEAARPGHRAPRSTEHLRELAALYPPGGVAAQDRHEWAEAEHHYHRSVAIGLDIDEGSGIAITYHQLGVLPQQHLGCIDDLGQVLLISRGCVHARTSSPVQPAFKAEAVQMVLEPAVRPPRSSVTSESKRHPGELGERVATRAPGARSALTPSQNRYGSG